MHRRGPRRQCIYMAAEQSAIQVEIFHMYSCHSAASAPILRRAHPSLPSCSTRAFVRALTILHLSSRPETRCLHRIQNFCWRRVAHTQGPDATGPAGGYMRAAHLRPPADRENGYFRMQDFKVEKASSRALDAEVI